MRPRATILVKLLVALVLPALILFTLFAFVAHEVSRRDLDEEVGQRLQAIASSAATQMRGKYLVDLAAGSEGDRGYQNYLNKLQAFEAAGARQTAARPPPVEETSASRRSPSSPLP